VNISDILSTTTLDAISTDVQAAMMVNAQQYAQDEFLAGRIGQAYLGLHHYPEAARELLNHWTQPGNVGNDPQNIGTGKPTASYTFTPDDPAILTAVGPPNDYANIYLYMKLSQPPSTIRRIVDMRAFQIKDLTGWQALEFQWQFTQGGLTKNGAWQANMVRKVWRYFDYTNTKWVDFPSIPFPEWTIIPVNIAAEFALDGSSVTHESLTLNGVKYLVGIKQNATPTKNADKATIAVQIDPKKGGACALAISQCDLRSV
jgi:hypothetical protein